MAWTLFKDSFSGGALTNPPYEYIYVEAPEEEARVVFEREFTHPDNATCPCCGPDYMVDEQPTLEQLSAFERGCYWDSETKSYLEVARDDYRPLFSLDDWIRRPDVMVIYREMF